MAYRVAHFEFPGFGGYVGRSFASDVPAPDFATFDDDGAVVGGPLINLGEEDWTLYNPFGDVIDEYGETARHGMSELGQTVRSGTNRGFDSLEDLSDKGHDFGMGILVLAGVGLYILSGK